MENKNEPMDIGVMRFDKDTTSRLSFRNGDMLLHFRFEIFNGELLMVDVWELKDSQFATITNRVEDLPEWFQLHPTEVCNGLVNKMMGKIDKGEYPPEPVDGPNIWRVRSGDTIIWIGDKRTDIDSQGGILKIFKFMKSSIIIGEPMISDYEQFLEIGSLSDEPESEKMKSQIKIAVSIARSMGVPREMDTTWLLG